MKGRILLKKLLEWICILTVVMISSVPVYGAEVKESSEVIKNGWVTENDSVFYYEENQLVTNQWITDSNGDTYWIDENGQALIDSWVIVDNNTYRVDSSGKLLKNTWVTVGKDQYRVDAKGELIKSAWVTVGKDQYHVDAKGKLLKSAWVTVGKNQYRVDAKGKLLKNTWVTVGKNQYRVDAKGKLLKNTWVTIGKNKYRVNAGGKLLKSTWVTVGKNKFYVDGKGILKTNAWITYKGRTYRVNSKGVLYTNKTFKVKNKSYTAYKNGVVAVKLNVPLIRQMPELPTGCEITSITQILSYAGAKVNKIQLAKEMPKHKYDPNKGFVGSPFKNSGWTIYPSALKKLVKKYTGSVKDMTRCSINTLKVQLAKGKPIAVWVNNWGGWNLHCVVLTGYNGSYFYYNDCSSGKKNGKISIASFKVKWKKWGYKALSY